MDPKILPCFWKRRNLLAIHKHQNIIGENGLKGGMKMSRKLIVAFTMLFLMCGYIASAEAQEKSGAAPIITKAFAAKEIRPGETWKIYLNATTPNGDMKNIYAIVYQQGVGQYPTSIIRLKGNAQKELSGYIYLWTSTPWHPMDYTNLGVTVQIQDQNGNFSDPVFFGLKLNARSSQEAPPQGIFKEQELGPIMVRLKTVDGGNGGGSEAGGSR
jgi:hypothetical protein